MENTIVELMDGTSFDIEGVLKITASMDDSFIIIYGATHQYRFKYSEVRYIIRPI